MNLGCVQGSVLGPTIYAIFMRPLGDFENDLTSYADDTYGVIELENTHDLTNISTKILDHLKWLRKSGMLVNDSKTEIMVVHKSDKLKITLQIGETLIESKNNMKVLGILFNQNLSWTEHVTQNINSCQRVLHGLKIVRKYFDEKKFRDITTSFLFTKLFYAYEVWSYNMLSFNCKKLLDSFYYKVCRVIIKDYECLITRENINLRVKRATPSEYSNYCLARTFIIAHNCNDSPIKEICNNNTYTITRKPGQLFCYDSSRIRIERNCFKNKINEITKSITFPWQGIKFDRIRPGLKRTYFRYSDPRN